ncbi:uncharacterized protein LOC111830064 isoform X2 [Capsella rubella]|uniref:uncharacterized protein LOC111830064 isoform X2 n=1 Tax=Capsella rubella TaxID=81985 RepID=UPI000CD4CE02|nr:uncharacterized protein LOC111830064 isoform X2 [Capsella rubella]
MNVLVFEFRVQALSVQELIEELASPNNTSRTMAMNYAKPLYTTSTKRSQEPEQENQFVYRNGALRWSCVIFWFPKEEPIPICQRRKEIQQYTSSTPSLESV